MHAWGTTGARGIEIRSRREREREERRGREDAWMMNSCLQGVSIELSRV